MPRFRCAVLILAMHWDVRTDRLEPARSRAMRAKNEREALGIPAGNRHGIIAICGLLRMPEQRAFVLFDIDGTLLSKAGPHHKQALVEAIREVTGREASFDGVDTSGMLDRDLIRILLRSSRATIREINAWMPAIVEYAQHHYGTICPLLHDRVCPGVVDFLYLLKHARIPAGLVTGNLTAIGWKKMEAAGLRAFFEVGAFAEMARTRASLARIALREARCKGLVARGTVVSLVGDHPNDIRAAKLNSIRSIAVATGMSTPEELASHDPDVLVPDLRSLRLESLL